LGREFKRILGNCVARLISASQTDMETFIQIVDVNVFLHLTAPGISAGHQRQLAAD
jgi:hypothetical protein